MKYVLRIFITVIVMSIAPLGAMEKEPDLQQAIRDIKESIMQKLNNAVKAGSITVDMQRGYIDELEGEYNSIVGQLEGLESSPERKSLIEEFQGWAKAFVQSIADVPSKRIKTDVLPVAGSSIKGFDFNKIDTKTTETMKRVLQCYLSLQKKTGQDAPACKNNIFLKHLYQLKKNCRTVDDVRAEFEKFNQQKLVKWEGSQGRDRKAYPHAPDAVEESIVLNSDGSMAAIRDLYNSANPTIESIVRSADIKTSSIRVFDTKTFKQIAKFEGDKDVIGLIFSPDSTFLLSFTEKKVYVWNILTGKQEKQFASPYPISKLLFSPDANSLVGVPVQAIFADKFVIALWDVKTWSVKDSIILKKMVRDVVFAGDLLAILCVDGEVKYFQLDQNGRYVEQGTYSVYKNKGLIAIDFSKDGKKMVLGFKDGSVWLRDRTTKKIELLRNPEPALNPARDTRKPIRELLNVQFIKNDSIVLFIGNWGVEFYDLGLDKQIKDITSFWLGTTLSSSKNGELIAGYLDGKIRLYCNPLIDSDKEINDLIKSLFASKDGVKTFYILNTIFDHYEKTRQPFGIYQDEAIMLLKKLPAGIKQALQDRGYVRVFKKK